MFRTICKTIDLPRWATAGTRWARFEIRDRLLDGTFYDSLQYSFYDEMVDGQEVPLSKRRPSSQYHMPRMVARWSSRKLWAGRHVPRIRHKDKTSGEIIGKLVTASKLFVRMQEATILGSVGSVGMTFRVDTSAGEGDQIAIRVWRAKFCTPTMDDADNLRNLRIHYIVTGQTLLSMDLGGPPPMPPGRDSIEPQDNYWFIRDFFPQGEITWGPVRYDDWNPVQGFVRPGYSLREWQVIPHNLGFVPAVWIRNLPNDCGVDGAGTWDDAIDMSIELDYLISQMTRGTRYNCAPQLVVTGEFAEDPSDEGVIRSPSHTIHLKGDWKGGDGTGTSGGDAKLLEMSGKGMEVADKLCDRLRNMALEQIGAVRKDPEKLHGVLSGRAMEFLDEDAHDLVMELRRSYGDAMMEIVRKMVAALGLAVDTQSLKMVWPRLYQPTPEDLAHLIPALVQAASPIMDESDPPSGPSGEGGAGGRPAEKAGKSLGALLEVDEASTFLRVNMDLDVILSEDDAPKDDDTPVDDDPPPRRAEHVDGAGQTGQTGGSTPLLEGQLADI